MSDSATTSHADAEPGLGKEGHDLVWAVYGGTYHRLVEGKNRWGPDDLFRMNQNVKPTP